MNKINLILALLLFPLVGSTQEGRGDVNKGDHRVTPPVIILNNLGLTTYLLNNTGVQNFGNNTDTGDQHTGTTSYQTQSVYVGPYLMHITREKMKARIAQLPIHYKLRG